MEGHGRAWKGMEDLRFVSQVEDVHLAAARADPKMHPAHSEGEARARSVQAKGAHERVLGRVVCGEGATSHRCVGESSNGQGQRGSSPEADQGS